jgi:hypothetical protein
VVYTLVLASPPDTPGDWTTYAYRVCAIPLGYLAAAANDGSRIVWALDCYRREHGIYYPDVMTEYPSFRAVVSPWLQLPETIETVPWSFVSYDPQYDPLNYRLVLYYRYGPYQIIGTASGVSVVPR